MALTVSMLCSLLSGFGISAKADTVVFKHQNNVGSQTPYSGTQLDEVTIDAIPDVIQGMRINQPVFRAEGLTASKSYTAVQELKDGTVIKSDTVTADTNGTIEFKHARNCEMIEILDGEEVVASLGTEKDYTNGVMITYAPMSWQVFQRDENDKATITIKGVTEADDTPVSVEIDGTAETVTVTDKSFTYTKELSVGQYDITVKSGTDTVAAYEKVAVGDVWVAAGQSNMTDMGAITDGFDPETGDQINDNMHIIYAEDTTWHKMSHPAGEGRFFKSGVRTSPVTSFAREIAASENVPVGIVQSSVGGTNIYQWVSGVRDSDPNSGYLIKALESCFDKMPSHNVKGILWYQGCNDAINENYAYDYKNLQQKVFDAMRDFFGADTPIITTQINDANQDSTAQLGYYDAWSFVKDIQRQNSDLYDNVYVIGTSDLELGDTIHNSAKENLKVGARWAKVAKNVIYGHTDVNYKQPTIESAKVTGDKEITLTFKDTSGLKKATGTKRIGITNGLHTETLGDLTKEFTVRKGASKTVVSSNNGKGTEMEIASAEIVDKTKVVITTTEELAGVVAVDCMYGKRFTPTLVDGDTDESVIAFFNVIAEYENAPEITPAKEIEATETATLDDYNKAASDSIMYVNNWSNQNVGYALMKFSLPNDVDLSTIASAKIAAYATEIVQDRSGNTTVSEIKNDNSWDKTSTYGDPDYADIKIKDIKTINSNTAAIFPVNNYSAIDVSDYLRSYTGTSIGIGIGTNYASVLTLAGKNSEHPPKLIIQPGKKAELTYTLGGEPCADMEVTVEAVGATEYQTQTFTTDANGKIILYLTEGSYKATTEKEIGERNASSNAFTVSNANVTESYTLTANTEEKPAVDENPTYTFGSAYSLIKDFDQTSLSETKIGNTGMKISTSSSNWNNVVVRDKSSTNSGYYPYGTGLPENGYYLFLGSGGSGGVTATLKFDNPIKAGKYIKVTYAKPKATNNGSSFRNEPNNNASISVGGEVIDLKTNCDWDKWYTTTMKVGSDISQFDISLGAWSAIAISKIEVMESADTMELTATDNTTEMYITSENRTLQYTATVYKSITTLMDSSDIIARGAADTDASVSYSVNGYENVSINANGLLTVTPEAAAGTVTVSAEYGSVKKNLPLELKAVGDADGVKIVGDEMVAKNGTLNLKAIPTVSGTIIPERATTWTIDGDALGCSIADGVLTARSTAGNITVKATLKVEGKQTTADVSDTFVVTVKGDTVSPYSIKGVFLKNCVADLSTAKGVDGIAVDTDTVSAGYKAVVKAIDTNGLVLAQTSVSLDSAAAGVTEIKTPLEFTNAAQIKAYIINSNNEVVSEEIYKTTETLYKNVPLVSDWITGEKSGLGMGAGIMAPTGAPYGVDPSVVDVSALNVSYSNDTDYPEPSADNALWYKTGAYLAGNSSGNNSIYARDGADWEQKVLPIGNGYMGAMLFGLPDKDQIQLNEETFWAAGYRGTQTAVNANTVNSKMSEGINGFMSVGNLFVDFNMPKNASIKNYYRDLNLDDAVAHVQYEYNGTKYSREYFASYPKEVVAIRYTADTANALSFDVKPVSMHPGEVTVNEGEITIIGKLKDSEPYASGGNAAWNQESDLEYCTKIKVIADGGTVTDGYNTVNVKNANAVTILVAAATDYDKDQFTIKSDGTVDTSTPAYKSKQGVQAAINKATSRINGAAEMTYDALKTEHLTDYHSQFNKVKFTLTDDDEVCKTPTDELQSNYSKVVGTTTADGKTTVSYDAAKYAALDKHLEELHFNYARYMMISSSRSTTMPANLQGKWCQSTAEIWGSCYCININMEMNYWFAGGANLLDSTKSLIRWFNSQIPAGTVTAKNMYKVTPKSYTFDSSAKTITFKDSTDDKDDVFIMHTKQAIMGTTDLTGGTSIQSAGNTAWLMYNLWDMYQTSGDKTLLANDIYPIMRKAANFYTQYLYTNEKKTTTDTEKYPDGYYYTTWAGRSPEQGPTHEGIKYDLQLVAGMYDYTIAAAETLGVDADKVAAWKEIRNHLEAPVELGADGEIKEWAEEVSYNTDANGAELGDPVHRHISHLVGLYPGTLINRDTPEYLEGAKIVLQNRGDDSTGWSCSNKFLLWARALEGDKALELFRYQLAKKTYSNLFDTHAPFQIDGNFGSAAGVMELLMQSQTGDIYILPALPKAWDKGEISGIKAKNGAEISIKWKEGKATEIKIKPVHDGALTIGYDKGNIQSLNGQAIEFDKDGMLTISDAKAGQTYTLSSATGAEPEREITSLTASHVTAKGGASDTLMVAGYDEHNALVKFEIMNSLDSDISGYNSCKTIKAFLWDNLNDMKPYDSKEITVTQ